MRRTPMHRGEPLKRTELKRGTSELRRTELRRGVPLRLVSDKKRVATKRKVRKPDVPAATRRAVYERDGYRCVAGGCWIGRDGGHVHHRLKRSQGGDHSLPNLLVLCPFHHGEVHRLVGLAYRLGYLIRRGVDPATVPIESAWPDGVAA
jgi:hypothetical protein